MPRHLRGPAVLAGLLGLGGLAACPGASEPAGSAPEARQTPAQAVGSAASADAELCEEHGVLQSVCPRCNPRLAAVFQAKGDWCAEHGFPESFCPTCAPEAGGRPHVAPTVSDGAPADGTLVRFRTRAAAEQAGLEVVPAEESEWVEGTEALARIAWDPTRLAVVSARAPGVVEAVRADVGDPVSTGQVLALVRSAHAAGDRSRLEAARRAREVAAAEVGRKAELLAGGVSAERELLAAEQALAAAEAELADLEAELALVGGGAGDQTVLRSPLDGVVASREVGVGQAVDGQQVLFEVVDPSRVQAEVDLPEAELGAVAVGAPVQLRLDALPEVVVEGRIAAVSPVLDPLSRTARARVLLDNPDGRLRANLYGRATVLGETAQRAVVVPSAAVQRAGEAWLVFVRQEVDTYVARRVRVLSRQGARVRIAGGVGPGDPVVTTGSFLLKTETLKDSIGAGCCDVE